MATDGADAAAPRDHVEQGIVVDASGHEHPAQVRITRACATAPLDGFEWHGTLVGEVDWLELSRNGRPVYVRAPSGLVGEVRLDRWISARSVEFRGVGPCPFSV